MKAILLRRLTLAGSGATFGAIALLAAIAPRPVAEAYGLSLDSVDAFQQFRAVFVGFWLGLALWMIRAARKDAPRELGDLAGAAILFQASARLFSVLADGVPDIRFVGAMIGEAIAALIILGAPRFTSA